MTAALESVGYKALLYLHYSLKGRGFPSGEIRPDRVPSLRTEMVQFLLRPDLTGGSKRRLRVDVGHGSQPRPPAQHSEPGRFVRSRYPYLRVLVRLDCQCLIQAFDHVLEAQSAASEASSHEGQEEPLHEYSSPPTYTEIQLHARV